MKHFFLSFLFLVLSGSLKAASVKLASLTSDWEDNHYELFVELNDQNQIEYLKLFDISSQSWQRYYLDDLSEGVVLKEVQKQKVLVMYSSTLNIIDGGEVQIEFLKNIFTGEYRKLAFTIAQQAKHWGIFYHGQRAQEIHFITNRVVSKPIGIKRVVVR